MSRPAATALVLVVLSLVGCAVASTHVAMVIAPQDNAPARLVQTTHGLSDLLTAARLKNGSDKRIRSYQIGWAYVRPNGIEFHMGVLMRVPAGIKPGHVHDVVDQAVPFEGSAERVIFFVAEVTFADGSHWKADHDEIQRVAGLP